MAKEPEVVRLPRSERLRDSKRQATSMSLPLAVHHRLDLLAEAARDVGATRAELVGMLIARASLEAADLESAILRYRKLTVGDVVPEEPGLEKAPEPEDVEAMDNVVSITKRGPGRPGRHEAR